MKCLFRKSRKYEDRKDLWQWIYSWGLPLLCQDGNYLDLKQWTWHGTIPSNRVKMRSRRSFLKLPNQETVSCLIFVNTFYFLFQFLPILFKRMKTAGRLSTRWVTRWSRPREAGWSSRTTAAVSGVSWPPCPTRPLWTCWWTWWRTQNQPLELISGRDGRILRMLGCGPMELNGASKIGQIKSQVPTQLTNQDLWLWRSTPVFSKMGSGMMLSRMMWRMPCVRKTWVREPLHISNGESSNTDCTVNCHLCFTTN